MTRLICIFLVLISSQQISAATELKCLEETDGGNLTWSLSISETETTKAVIRTRSQEFDLGLCSTRRIFQTNLVNIVCSTTFNLDGTGLIITVDLERRIMTANGIFLLDDIGSFTTGTGKVTCK